MNRPRLDPTLWAAWDAILEDRKRWAGEAELRAKQYRQPFAICCFIDTGGFPLHYIWPYFDAQHKELDIIAVTNVPCLI